MSKQKFSIPPEREQQHLQNAKIAANEAAEPVVEALAPLLVSEAERIKLQRPNPVFAAEQVLRDADTEAKGVVDQASRIIRKEDLTMLLREALQDPSTLIPDSEVVSPKVNRPDVKAQYGYPDSRQPTPNEFRALLDHKPVPPGSR